MSNKPDAKRSILESSPLKLEYRHMTREIVKQPISTAKKILKNIKSHSFLWFKVREQRRKFRIHRFP